MKARMVAVLLAAASVGRLFAAEAGIEFAGVLGAGKDTRVALTNKANGSTQWVPVGGTYAGYTIVSYEPATDVLLVKKDNQEFRLALRSARVARGAAKAPPALERAVLNNLRQLAAAADQFYLENGKTSATYDDLVGATKYVKVLNPVDGENYRSIQFSQGTTLVVTTASGYAISYAP